MTARCWITPLSSAGATITPANRGKVTFSITEAQLNKWETGCRRFRCGKERLGLWP